MNIHSNSQMFLDIETYPAKDSKFIKDYVNNNIDKRLKDPQKIEENKAKLINKLALSPITGSISMIGISHNGLKEIAINKTIIDTDETVELLNKFADKNITILEFPDEKKLLEYVIDLINEAVLSGTIIVTFNGKKFDFPFIFYRALINKTDNVISNFNDHIKPYSFEPHFDLRQLLNEGTLNELSHIINQFDYTDADGAEVIDMITNHEYEKAFEKLVSDLVKTEKLFESVNNWVNFRTYITTR